MTPPYTTPASVELLARVADAGPLTTAQLADGDDYDARNRVAALCYDLCRAGALRRLRPGLFDLGPEAPWWARKLRGMSEYNECGCSDRP